MHCKIIKESVILNGRRDKKNKHIQNYALCFALYMYVWEVRTLV